MALNLGGKKLRFAEEEDDVFCPSASSSGPHSSHSDGANQPKPTPLSPPNSPASPPHLTPSEATPTATAVAPAAPAASEPVVLPLLDDDQ